MKVQNYRYDCIMHGLCDYNLEARAVALAIVVDGGATGGERGREWQHVDSIPIGTDCLTWRRKVRADLPLPRCHPFSIQRQQGQTSGSDSKGKGQHLNRPSSGESQWHMLLSQSI